jgi:hypothetical protein
MSRFYQDYAEAEPMDTLIRRLQYQAMMSAKSEVEQFGARMLASYRARRRAAA